MISREQSRLQPAAKMALQSGLERAAAALTVMLHNPVSIRLGPERPPLAGVSIWLTLTGATPGGICLCLPETLALELAKRLTRSSVLSLLDEMARSALMECGNVLASAFVAWFDERYALRSLPLPPAFSLIPLQLPDFSVVFDAEFAVEFCQIRGQVQIGLDAAGVCALQQAGENG
jgi:hypothetical protein